jgi:hypothetical protein
MNERQNHVDSEPAPLAPSSLNGQYLTFVMPSKIDNNPAIPIADEL